MGSVSGVRTGSLPAEPHSSDVSAHLFPPVRISSITWLISLEAGPRGSISWTTWPEAAASAKITRWLMAEFRTGMENPDRASATSRLIAVFTINHKDDFPNSVSGSM